MDIRVDERRPIASQSGCGSFLICLLGHVDQAEHLEQIEIRRHRDRDAGEADQAKRPKGVLPEKLADKDKEIEVLHATLGA